MQRYRYDRQGVLAMEPKAFLGLFAAPEPPVNDVSGDASIVAIRGPLDHHPGWWCDSYDAIKARVKAACEAAPGHIVLLLDSPGGDVSGCFETAQQIRKMAADAGKTLLAYVDGQACSGAYALACAATKIVVPPTGFVGSVGVIQTRVDLTAYDAKEGFRFAVTTSGARKADGHPHVGVTEGESAATQTIIDSLAEVFFAVVHELRGTKPAELKALEAGVFHGDHAVARGLADQVMSFSEMLEAIESGAFAQVSEVSMAKSKVDEARSALEEAAKSEDEKEAKRAKRALAAMDEDEEPESEDEGEEPESEDDDAPPPESEDEPKSEEDKDDEESAKAAAKADPLTQKLFAKVNKLSADSKRRERAEVREFLAGCKWLTKEARDMLQGEPLEKVKALAASLKPKVPKAAAAAEVSGTRGASQVGTGAPGGTTNLSGRGADMDEIMGVHKTKRAVVHEGSRTIIGATVPDRKDV